MVYEEGSSTNVVEVLTADGEVRLHLRHMWIYSTTVYQYKPQYRHLSERTNQDVKSWKSPRRRGYRAILQACTSTVSWTSPALLHRWIVPGRGRGFMIVQDADYIASAPAGGDSDQSHCIATRISLSDRRLSLTDSSQLKGCAL